MKADLAAILKRPIAHRGLHDESRGVIENSMTAARAAIVAGYGIECDVQLSADGEAMVFHDETLDRLTQASGLVLAHPAKELAGIALKKSREQDGRSDFIPTLEALLSLIAGRVPAVIEIKSVDDQTDMRLAARAVALVARYRGPLALKSFNPKIMAHCRAIGASGPLGLVGPDDSRHPAAALTADDLSSYDFLSWNIAILSELRETHPNLPLMTWTVRSNEQHDVASKSRAQIVFEAFRPTIYVS